jgi:ABC-type lipoprotein export system ATPase subunit
MISLLDVTKEYRLDEDRVIMPVRNVTLEIDAGDFIMVVGRSGSGKTTLLNLMAGLVNPTHGRVLVDDRDFRAMADRQVSSLRAQKIGFVFQFPSLLPSLSVLENVMIPSAFRHRPAQANSGLRAAELLRMVGLSDRVSAHPRQLSAGEQKRVALARSLMNKPQILLADEPTSDLDEQTEREVIALLRRINQTGVTIVMVTHSLELLPYATRAFKMDNGVLSGLADTGRNAVG